MKTNSTLGELMKALDIVNAKYHNITFNRHPENISKNRIRFTLRVIRSRGMGGRLSFSTTSKGNRRHIPSACWHVHGDFFDALFEINPNIWIKCHEKKISKDGGNWEDRDIGSMMNPLMYSEACDCDTK